MNFSIPYRFQVTTPAVFVIACGVAGGVELPQEILARLSGDDFAVRETAEADLLKWSRAKRDSVMLKLLNQSRDAEDPEIRQRCRNVLRALVLDEYLKEGEGYIGIRMSERLVAVPGDDKVRYGIDIEEVVDDSPAAAAKLVRGDTIVSIEGTFWREPGALTDFSTRVPQLKPTSQVTLKVLRGQEVVDVAVLLGRKPPMLDGATTDQAGRDRAAKEAFFREWLNRNKTR